MDYILFVKADVTLQPNPEEVMVRRRAGCSVEAGQPRQAGPVHWHKALLGAAAVFRGLPRLWRPAAARSLLGCQGLSWTPPGQDTRYVSWQELREMMDPSSGLLWSPWFRWGSGAGWPPR
jgi:hypothetical protein